MDRQGGLGQGNAPARSNLLRWAVDQDSCSGAAALRLALGSIGLSAGEARLSHADSHVLSEEGFPDWPSYGSPDPGDPEGTCHEKPPQGPSPLKTGRKTRTGLHGGSGPASSCLCPLRL